MLGFGEEKATFTGRSFRCRERLFTSEVFCCSSFQEDRYCVAFFEGTAFWLIECMQARNTEETIVMENEKE